ncbi:MarR family winged helix-turn-helix transcriptional regulator [Caulobacter segnis]|uniref:MarR family transcriptional regulator n=1 Tax=Caulobacter segnis TaxID=88688 RepID=A0A2W5V9V5_9CAUL|nr:MarR family winged helix-turn-helix transcriptional regulator [Caulobacter segnis]PZR36550.1 MAG: MarR family transcriptional regulator [Caulobacter segnis]
MTATVSPITTSAPDAPEAAVSLSDYVPYRLATASAAVSRLIARAYEDRFGLTIPQWRLMSVLAEGALTPHAAVTRTAMDKVRVSRAAQDLVVRRLVARTTVRSDRRSHTLELTAAGRRLFAEIAPLALAYEATLLAGLAPSEVATFKRLLNHLETAAIQLAGGETITPP